MPKKCESTCILCNVVSTKRWEVFLLVLFFAISFAVRFWDLGYSHFYPDETKTFYLDKTVPAAQFFLDQRKGPLQFFVVWVTEKFIGGYDEFLTRVPFAAAGFLSVVAFYFLVKRAFGPKTGPQVAILAAALYSFNGLSIAFSRTIQYQSFLFLFGFLALYFFYSYLENSAKKTRQTHLQPQLVISAIFMALAFYAHYDAIFFLLPVFYMLAKNDALPLPQPSLKNFALKFLLPFLLLIAVFYAPYIYSGYFQANTYGYLSRRITGYIETGLNYSVLTYFIYNPSLLLFLPFLAGFWLFFTKQKISQIMPFVFWFIAGFVTFQLIISNPGTHIQNYLTPLYVIAAYAIYLIYSDLEKRTVFKNLFITVLSALVSVNVAVMLFSYVPYFNKGYPWNEYAGIRDTYQLFVYGFPYNRGWDQIRNYFGLIGGRVEGVYTNDNDVLAQYYLRGFNYTKPGTNFIPQYYIHVYNNHEFTDFKMTVDWKPEFLSRYEKVKDFYVNGVLAAVVYRRL